MADRRIPLNPRRVLCRKFRICCDRTGRRGSVDEQRSRRSDTCPRWCVTQHDDADEGWDGHHASTHVLVPVITPRVGQGFGGNLERHVEATDVAMLAQRRADEPATTWIHIVGERQSLEVTLESARRLHGELGQLLDRVD